METQMEAKNPIFFKSNDSYKKIAVSTIAVILILMMVSIYLGSSQVDWKNHKLWGKNIEVIYSEIQKSIQSIINLPTPTVKDANTQIQTTDSLKNDTNIQITGGEYTPLIEKTNNGIRYKIQNKNTTIEVETNTQINRN